MRRTHLARLMRQAVQEIERQRFDAATAKQAHGLRHQGVRLHPAHALLHARVAVMHAERQAVHRGFDKSRDLCNREQPRIDFNGVVPHESRMMAGGGPKRVTSSAKSRSLAMSVDAVARAASKITRSEARSKPRSRT